MLVNEDPCHFERRYLFTQSHILGYSDTTGGVINGEI